MKQILQNLRTGSTEVVDVPAPMPRRGHVLIRTSRTLVSTGTERMLVEFGKAGWLEKARQQPDKVRMVLNKVRTDGLVPTLNAVRNKLDQPLQLGYCNVGAVLDGGAGATAFAPGTRVASAGRHAEVVNVPATLCARVPDTVPDDHAAFTVLGAIALQGIRLVQPSLGETVVVTGLGLIGLVTVQLLRAHGCRVLGLDFDPARLELARRFGAEVFALAEGEDPVPAARTFSRARGVDAVIITAATESNEPVHQAAAMCRKRGRIVLVGVAGLELSRADFYEKELTFQVSCSYGPGRYDPEYEERGHDYPVGFVRWTAQRNFEAVLDMMADGRLDVAPLISHRFSINAAGSAYELVAGSEPSLGILLEYPQVSGSEPLQRLSAPVASRVTRGAGRVNVGFIGAGNYATAVLIPAFRAAGAKIGVVVSGGGVSSVHAARKFGAERAGTDAAAAIADPAINTIVVATRHDSHAALVCEALRAGKHVFVEKPLALTGDEVDDIERALDASDATLMVGFNRRFAPQTQKLRTLLAGITEPKAFVVTVNAGDIPPEHWTQESTVGGGRIVGEGCHFIDLLRHLAGAPIAGFDATSMHGIPGLAVGDDRATITLRFADGSFGAIHYLANGHRSFPKERVEVFAAGRVVQIDNFRRMTGYGWPAFQRMNLWRQDKGQGECAAAFVRAVERGGAPPISRDELIEVSRRTIEIAEQLRGSPRAG